MAQINMAQKPQSGLDALAKALNVAQSIYGITADMSRLDMAKKQQENAQSQADLDQAEKERIKSGFFNQNEALAIRKDFDEVPVGTEGSFGVKIIGEDGPVDYAFKRKSAPQKETNFALGVKEQSDFIKSGGRIVPAGAKNALTVPAIGVDGQVTQIGLIPPDKMEAQRAKDNKLRELPADKVLLVNEGNSIPALLQDIKGTIADNKNMFGPVSGRLSSANPYNTDSQTIDAQMRAASQAFGRYMEGGVLRKEDEEKYRKMFPNLPDTPAVAANKLQVVERLLAKKQNSNLAALKAQGFDITGLDQNLTVPDMPNMKTNQDRVGLIQEAQAGGRKSVPDAEDLEALDWLSKNPNHKQAEAVRAKLRIKGL